MHFPRQFTRVVSVMVGVLLLIPRFTFAYPLEDTAETSDAPNGAVEVSLPMADGSVYIGGTFTQVDGQARAYIAHLLPDGNLDTSFNATATGTFVGALELSEDGLTLYVGGDFTAIGGQTRANLAELDIETGVATAWDPSSDGPIYTIELNADDDVIYVGGEFTTVGGETRDDIAAIDLSGNATAWNPGGTMNGTNVILYDAAGGYVYVGGLFTAIGGQARTNLAVLVATTGAATAFTVAMDAVVSDIAYDSSDDMLYVAGDFTTIGGEVRSGIAKIDVGGVSVTAWHPSPTGPIGTLELDAVNGVLYVGGLFSNVGGVPRNNLAAVSTTTALATDFNPGPDGSVYDVALRQSPYLLATGGGFGTGYALYGASAGSTQTIGAMNATEAGTTDTYTFVLSARPTNDVVIEITGDADITPAPTTITFTTLNWAITQTVTVTAVDDALVEGDHTGTVTHVVTSTDLDYDGMVLSDVVVDIADNDVGGGGGGGGSGSSYTPLVPPSVTVLSPNGGEQLTPGSIFPIKWETKGRVDLVNVTYSVNGGETWTPISTAQPVGAGQVAWQVPSTPAASVLVRVEATDLVIVYASDESNASFHIGTVVQVTPDPATVQVVLVRSTVSPTVYFWEPGTATRRPFLNEITFFSHGFSFKDVVVRSTEELAGMPLGAPMLPKAGAVLVKLESVPVVYVTERIESDPARLRLRPIASEADAFQLAGPAWADYVIDLPVTAFSRMVIGDPANASTPVDRSLLRRRVELR